MKTEFKAKFLQHLSQKKQDKGFTLIELLVVVIIIGILAAVALPSLLSQTNKAKQAEARQNVGAMNRAQQSYFLEQNKFAGDLTALGVGLRTQTTNFKYGMNLPAPTTADTQITNYAQALGKNLKSYMGSVYLTEAAAGGVTESLTLAYLCETKSPSSTTVAQSGTGCDGNSVALGE
jgi:type IV pilus assembly protein PilA